MSVARPIVSPQEWLAARRALLLKENQLTRLQDQLGGPRRALPWKRLKTGALADPPHPP